MLEITVLGILFGTSSAFTVGPIFIMIVQTAATQGFRASCNIIYGSAVADIVFLVAAYALAAGMFSIESLLPLLTTLGAMYFLWVGYSTLRETFSGDFAAGPLERKSAWNIFLSGVMGNLANPSTWIFWAAVGGALLLNVHKTAGHLGMIVFTALWFGVAMLWEAGIALLCARMRSMLTTKTLKAINFSAGVLFVMMALMILGRALWTS